tara:strand:+ start:3205 stop:3543 length:339 start_codon:yes stop_codon:yes gene_type:complete
MPSNLTLVGEECYLTLLSELWHEFGQSKELKKEIELRQDLMEANLNYLQANDRSLLNDIKLIKSDLDKLMNDASSDVDYDFDKEAGKLGEHLGMIIKQKETSVFEYYASTRS